jgi:predicted negative regulator of RcsB-dependent stress response
MFNYSSDREQSEALQSWWGKNKLKCIFAVVLLLSGIALMQNWQENKQARQVAAATAYSNLLSRSDINIANDILQNYPSSPYADLTNLWLAKQDSVKGSWQSAIDKYDITIKHSNVKALTSLAHWQKAHALVELKQFDAALNELNNVDQQELVNEYKGDIYAIMGKAKLAYTAYSAAITSSKDEILVKRILSKQQNLFLAP